MQRFLVIPHGYCEFLGCFERFRRAQRPVVGLGFGAQLVALQSGGSVVEDAREDPQFVRASVTPEGLADPVGTLVDGAKVLLFHRVRRRSGVPPRRVAPRGLASHMVDGRDAVEVIDELDALHARALLACA